MKFEEFVLSIAGGAYVQLGIVEDPFNKTKSINLDMAQASIELLEMLKEKTRNNLTKEEDDLIDNVLYDLRMKFVEEKSKKVSSNE